MHKIEVYVESGWDEIEEICEVLADALADKGYGIKDEDNEDEPISVILAVPDDSYTEATTEFIFHLAQTSRLITLPRLSKDYDGGKSLHDLLSIDTPDKLDESDASTS